MQGKILNSRKIGKLWLLRNVVVFWTAFYLLLLAGFSGVLYFLGLLEYSVLASVIMVFFVYHLGLFLTHHGLAVYHLWTDKLFSSKPAVGRRLRQRNPAGVREGTLVGVRLNTYLRGIGRQEWVNKIFNYMLTQKCSTEKPLILRSHLFSSPGMCAHLTKLLEKEGFQCSVSHNLPLKSKFILLWLTPAFLAAFQFYLPPLRDRETEFIITPAVERQGSLFQ